MKRILTILMVALVALSVTACKPRDKDKDNSSETSQSSAPETKASDEAKVELEKIVKSQYGKDAKITFVGEEKIDGKKCFAFKMDSGIVANAVIAITEDYKTCFQKDGGSGTFLPIEPILTPAKYMIDQLQNSYAGKLVGDINAIGGQIRGGTYKEYPTDFPEKANFPKVSDTEQLIYCYNETSYLDEDFNSKKIITIVLPIDDSHVMTCNPTMIDGDGEAKSLALANFKFEKNFNLESFAKDNDFQILKGNMVK
ncbi:MAG: hypothetical protein RR710_05505 [Oscillospiraceae bacterium]